MSMSPPASVPMEIDEILSRAKRTRLDTYTESDCDDSSTELHTNENSKKSKKASTTSLAPTKAAPTTAKQTQKSSKTNNKLIHAVDQLQKRVNEQEEDIYGLVSIIKDLRNQMKALQVQVNDTKHQVHPNVEQVVTDIVNAKHNEATNAHVHKCSKELVDRTKAERNVVISGLDDNTDTEQDNKRINEVLSKIGAPACKSTRRIRLRNSTPSDSRPPLVIVEFDTITAKHHTLKVAKSLRSIPELSKVYINPDKTATERATDKVLRDSRNVKNKTLDHELTPDGRLRYSINDKGQKWYWGIRNGELHPIIIKQSSPTTVPSTSNTETSSNTTAGSSTA